VAHSRTVADPLARAAGWAVGVAVVVAVVLNGAYAASVQAVVLLVLAVAAVLAAASRNAGQARARRAAPLLIAAGVGWSGALPLSEAMLGALAPGRVLPGVPVASLGGGWEVAATGAGPLLAAAAAIVLVGVAGPARETRIERGAAIALLALAALAVVHRAIAPAALYGFWPVNTAAYTGWAPLVNPNFVATIALFLLPVAAAPLLARRDLARPALWLLGAGVLAGATLVLATGSAGAAAAMIAIAALLGLRVALPERPWLRRGIAAVLAVPAAAGVAWAEATFGQASSVALRADQWGRTLRMIADHWLVGVGPWGYGRAFPPYQDPFVAARFDHAHSDALELMAELGVVGATLTVGAAALVWRARPREATSRATGLSLGLTAVALHALVDFPLHLPGIALLAAAGLGWRLGVYEPTAPAPAWRGRLTLGAGALLLVLAGGWQAHRAVIGAAIDRLGDPSEAEAANATIAAWAPWRPEPKLHRARALARDPAQADAARALATAVAAEHPFDAEVQLQAGAILTHLRDLGAAKVLLERAASRSASDHRSRALRSRIAEAERDPDGALAWWREAVRRWPYDAALADKPFDRALKLQPVGLWWVDALADGPAPHLSMLLGQELLRRGDADAALLAFDEGALGKPAYGLSIERARALVAVGRTDEALALLVTIDRALPDSGARREQASLLLRLDRPEDARAAARIALRRDPASAEAALLALQAAERIGGSPEVVAEADALPTGPVRADRRVAAAVVRHAVDAHHWAACIAWLRPFAGDDPELQATLRTCEERCPTCF
jgi:tetratricopeptide (TPR) repeat protein/O-antigen ligase